MPFDLDGPVAEITDRTRRTFGGHGVHEKVIGALEALRGYEYHSVICTATTENLEHLTSMVELFHSLEVPTCMINQDAFLWDDWDDATHTVFDVVLP